MNCAVAIFAKTPGLTALKTRLAASIGKENAERFYQLSVDCVETTLKQAREFSGEKIDPVWTVAEKEGPRYWSKRLFSAEWTGEGMLGTRLANVSERLFETHGSVILTGTDSPQLDSGRYIQALKEMKDANKSAIVGPAADGGFYLFGSSTPVPRHVWEAVTYSASTTLDELEGLLIEEGWKIKRLAEEQDVDVLADLFQLKENLELRKDVLTEPQQTLLRWLEDNQSLF